MKKTKRNIISLFVALVAFLILPYGAMAQNYPAYKGWVNDYSGALGQQEKQILDAFMQDVKKQTGLEIAFVIVDELEEDISLYATELAHHWGVGDKEDRGALLLYSTGKKDGHRQVYLAIGYGLEGQIPDAKAGRILDQVTIPRIKEGALAESFAATALTVTRMVYPEYMPSENLGISTRVPNRMEKRNVSPKSLILMIMIILILMGPRSTRSFIFGAFLGSVLGGSRNHWGSGGGFGGGGFGGGFGGFGGGGFGGGGAGRSF